MSLTVQDPRAGRLGTVVAVSGQIRQLLRIEHSLHARPDTCAALIAQGDPHALAVGSMSHSAELALAQPVHAIMTSTLGSGDLAFPSAFRRVETTPALSVAMQEALRPTEKTALPSST